MDFPLDKDVNLGEMQRALIREERDLSLLVPRSLPQKGDRGLVS